jgi:hypothetical protein
MPGFDLASFHQLLEFSSPWKWCWFDPTVNGLLSPE